MTEMVDGHSRSGAHEQSGYALPVVLVFLGIVAVISARFVGEARLELDIQRTMRARASLETLARDVALGVAPSWLDGVRGASVSFSCAGGDRDVSLALRRQDHLTDLNSAPAEDIAAALASIGLSAHSASDVAADIVRFRSYDPHGRSDAARDGIAGSLKRGPFEAVEELADFDALASVEPSRLRQVFTIRRRTGGAKAGHIAGAYAVEVRAVGHDGRVAAAFGAVMSLDPASPPARLLDIYDPDAATGSPLPEAQPCPEALADFIARRTDAAELER